MAYPLARLLWRLGQRQRAKTLAELAVEGYGDVQADQERDEVRAWLAGL